MHNAHKQHKLKLKLDAHPVLRVLTAAHGTRLSPVAARLDVVLITVRGALVVAGGAEHAPKLRGLAPPQRRESPVARPAAMWAKRHPEGFAFPDEHDK
eukprot:scaffold6336_cov112-Isochrysis_galbana.AAC.6